ncbi:MAG: hypothetical protein HPZ91_15465 [Lentisphaeria bacterium]|nr:hypothetical protein [Lentisphaeria bacterium]
MKRLLAALFAAAMPAAHALELPPGMTFEPNGIMKLGEASLAVSAAGPSWRWLRNDRWKNCRVESRDDRRTVDAEIVFDGVPGTACATLRKSGENSFRFHSSLRFSAPVESSALCMTLTLPLPAGRIALDGKAIPVPETCGNLVLQSAADAGKLELELTGGRLLTITGKLRVYIQDNRRWNETVSVRIYFTPAAGTVREAEVEFGMTLTPPAVRILGAGDGSAGKHSVAGIPFELPEGGIPAGVRLPVPPGARAINLLHTAERRPAAKEAYGTAELIFSDGRTELLPVREAVRSGAGELLASSLPFPGEAPAAVVFRPAGSGSWRIAAATVSDRPVRFPKAPAKPLTIREDNRWRPLRFERRILAGSPLDFSRSLDAPAGKYGFIRPAPEGGLTFEAAPDRRIRLYGVNLCMSANYLRRESADGLVAYLVRMGYNAVRLHHHDNALADPAAPDSTTLDPAQLDRLDYLFAKLKENGLYVTTDLYTSRVLKAGDDIPACDYYGRGQILKGLLPVNRGAMENWKKFARNWMEHRNPYTGLKWGEDPALFCLNLVNEETLTNTWNRHPELSRLYREKFETWKKTNGAEGGPAEFLRFLHELQSKALDEQLAFVRNELKLKTMVTSLNYINSVPLTLLRDKFDLVDNHQYFAHPEFPEKAWSLPHRYDQSSAIRRKALLPRLMMPTRIFGKPFIVTEFNFSNPNMFRAEGGPLAGAYAALQGWDGLWRFAWSHSADAVENARIGGSFNAVNDPMQQFSDRIILALFRRGDLTPAGRKLSFSVPEDPFRAGVPGDFPDEFTELGLNAQIGSHPAGKKPREGVTVYRPGMQVPADPRIRLDSRAGTFAVVTPLTETVTLPGGELSAGALRVKDADTFMTVAAISLDEKPLPQSKSILLIHLTNIAAANTRFRNGEMTLLESWGELPLLVERGTATVELKGDAPWSVTALAADGSEAGTVASEYRDGTLRFKADTCARDGGTPAYHLTR